MIGALLSVVEIETIREQPDSELIALHNVSVMGQSCLRVGDIRRVDEIFEVVVDALKARGFAIAEGGLIG